MSIEKFYIIKRNSIVPFFDSLLNASIPPKFTQKFLQNLGFKSVNDRLLIKLLKSLGFLDDSGVPTGRYKRYLDPEQQNRAIADGIQEAYQDLFDTNRESYNLNVSDVKGKLKGFFAGESISNNTFNAMANTFDHLVKLVDWEAIGQETREKIQDNTEQTNLRLSNSDTESPQTEEITSSNDVVTNSNQCKKILDSHTLGLHYNIQIILPESRDCATYDAIFSALKKHLING